MNDDYDKINERRPLNNVKDLSLIRYNLKIVYNGEGRGGMHIFYHFIYMYRKSSPISISSKFGQCSFI